MRQHCLGLSNRFRIISDLLQGPMLFPLGISRQWFLEDVCARHPRYRQLLIAPEIPAQLAAEQPCRRNGGGPHGF